MNITHYYNFNQGLSVISPYGLQKYTEKLDSYSSILNSIYTSDYNKNNKYCIDSCWESGNIYYANYDEGYVKKIRFDGTVLATLNLTNPYMVSIIQNSSSMNSTISYPSQEEIGCWIVDKGTGKIIKTDNNLNILKEIDYIVNPIAIIADVDGGCYVVSYYITSSIKGNLIKLSSDGDVVGIKNYSDFNPQVTGFIDMAIDSNGQLYFCANDVVYSLTYSDGNILQNYAISPITTDDAFSSSSSESFFVEEKHVGCIDVDRNSPYQPLYIAGGNSSESFIVKYMGGSLVAQKQYYDIGIPYVIKAIQGMGSDSLYILEDSSKWDDYGYGSSSSIDSSSSSSSKSSNSSPSSNSSSTSSKSSDSTSSSSEQDYFIWTRRDGSGITNKDFIEVTGNIGSNVLLATDAYNQLIKSTDFGVTWVQKHFLSGSPNRGVVCSDDVSEKLFYVNYDNYLYWSNSTTGLGYYIGNPIRNGASLWTSKSWKSTAMSGDGLRIAACYYGGEIITGQYTGIPYLYSFNIQEQNTPGSRNWNSIDISRDGSTVVACSDDGYIYTSSDFGASWNSYFMFTHDLRGVSVNYDGTVIYVFSYNYSSVYISRDYGNTFNIILLEPSVSMMRNGIDCSDDGSVVIIATNIYIMVSLDYGMTWGKQYDVAGPGQRNWYSVYVNGSGTSVAAVAKKISSDEYVWTGQLHLMDFSSSSSSSNI